MSIRQVLAECICMHCSQVAETSWSFDALELQEASGDMPLSSLGFYLIQASIGVCHPLLHCVVMFDLQHCSKSLSIVLPQVGPLIVS